jgi:tRNA pseudouridine38-40 synthase
VVSERRTGTFRLGIEYDGSDFHGWQIQRAHRSVQGELLDALRKLSSSPVHVEGAGRTDAGCHAVGQVASVTLTTRLFADRLRLALNALLPDDVRILEAEEVGPEFHARFDAMRRAYRYLIAPRPTAIRRRYAWVRRVGVGLDALNQASRPLLGDHDFTTFSKQGSEGAGACCRVTKARWSGRRGRLEFDIEADRFLYSMVRRVVSTVIQLAESGAGTRGVREALEARDRGAASPPAPAYGLYLMRVRYPRVGWIPKEPLDVHA